MSLTCGRNLIPQVITVFGSAWSFLSANANSRAQAAADAQARMVSASWRRNYPCPEDCSFLTVGFKTVRSVSRVSVIPFWLFTPDLFFGLG